MNRAETWQAFETALPPALTSNTLSFKRNKRVGTDDARLERVFDDHIRFSMRDAVEDGPVPQAFILTSGTTHYRTMNRAETWQAFETALPPALTSNRVLKK
jgi:hypothetical protein